MSHPRADKTALVTGAARGIGFALVVGLLDRGWIVYAAARDHETRVPLQEIRRGCARLRVVELDVANEESIISLAAAMGEATPSLDLLLNSAGMNRLPAERLSGGSSRQLGELTMEGLVELFKVNAAGPVLLVQHFANMLERAESSLVVNVSTSRGSLSLCTDGGKYGYRLGKAALNMSTRVLAHDLSGRGIRVIAVDPGWVRTDMGGPDAPLTPEAAAARLLALIEAAGSFDTGAWLDLEQRPVPW